MDDRQVFDRDELYERCGEDWEFVVELLDDFEGIRGELVDELDRGVESGDLEAVVEAAHSLKGAAANLAANAVKVTARTAEEAARDGRLDDARCAVEDVKGALAQLHEVTAALRAEHQPG